MLSHCPSDATAVGCCRAAACLGRPVDRLISAPFRCTFPRSRLGADYTGAHSHFAVRTGLLTVLSTMRFAIAIADAGTSDWPIATDCWAYLAILTCSGGTDPAGQEQE